MSERNRELNGLAPLNTGIPQPSGTRSGRGFQPAPRQSFPTVTARRASVVAPVSGSGNGNGPTDINPSLDDALVALPALTPPAATAAAAVPANVPVSVDDDGDNLTVPPTPPELTMPSLRAPRSVPVMLSLSALRAAAATAVVAPPAAAAASVPVVPATVPAPVLPPMAVPLVAGGQSGVNSVSSSPESSAPSSPIHQSAESSILTPDSTQRARGVVAVVAAMIAKGKAEEKKKIEDGKRTGPASTVDPPPHTSSHSSVGNHGHIGAPVINGNQSNDGQSRDHISSNGGAITITNNHGTQGGERKDGAVAAKKLHVIDRGGGDLIMIIQYLREKVDGLMAQRVSDLERIESLEVFSEMARVRLGELQTDISKLRVELDNRDTRAPVAAPISVSVPVVVVEQPPAKVAPPRAPSSASSSSSVNGSGVPHRVSNNPHQGTIHPDRQQQIARPQPSQQRRASLSDIPPRANANSSGNNNGNNSTERKGTDGRRPFTGECWACRRIGHRKAECPKYKCDRCGKNGHSSARCGPPPSVTGSRAVQQATPAIASSVGQQPRQQQRPSAWVSTSVDASTSSTEQRQQQPQQQQQAPPHPPPPGFHEYITSWWFNNQQQQHRAPPGFQQQPYSSWPQSTPFASFPPYIVSNNQS